MIIRKDIDVNAPLTEEEKKMLEEAANADYVPDDDCPELNDEQMEQFKKAVSRH